MIALFVQLQLCSDRTFLATIIFALHTEGDRSWVSVDFQVVGEASAQILQLQLKSDRSANSTIRLALSFPTTNSIAEMAIALTHIEVVLQIITRPIATAYR